MTSACAEPRSRAQLRPRQCRRDGAWGDLRPYGKQAKKKLETVELARYLLRERRAEATFVDGDRIELDLDEVFRDVKDKSADYRYLENTQTNQFFDIDRDYSMVIVWEGALGTKGTETVHEHNWHGEAKQHYKELLAAKIAEGYVEPPARVRSENGRWASSASRSVPAMARA